MCPTLSLNGNSGSIDCLVALPMNFDKDTGFFYLSFQRGYSSTGFIIRRNSTNQYPLRQIIRVPMQWFIPGSRIFTLSVVAPTTTARITRKCLTYLRVAFLLRRPPRHDDGACRIPHLHSRAASASADTSLSLARISKCREWPSHETQLPKGSAV